MRRLKIRRGKVLYLWKLDSSEQGLQKKEGHLLQLWRNGALHKGQAKETGARAEPTFGGQANAQGTGR